MSKKELTAYEKWISYWEIKVPWPAGPEPWESWNAAVEIIAEYISNYDDLDEGPKGLSKEILEKFLDK
ncbi:MAG: hypothetical protein AABY22_12450 [Nanoarchaeota archaeon]